MCLHVWLLRRAGEGPCVFPREPRHREDDHVGPDFQDVKRKLESIPGSLESVRVDVHTFRVKLSHAVGTQSQIKSLTYPHGGLAYARDEILAEVVTFQRPGLVDHVEEVLPVVGDRIALTVYYDG